MSYVTDAGKESLYWNIPIANTTSLLLGPGTSVTQAAVRELAKAGVLLGFCGGGGTPFFASMEGPQEVVWLQPQSEYRPGEYLQHWVRFWFDDELRLRAAQQFQQARLERIRTHWGRNRALKDQPFSVDSEALEHLLRDAEAALALAADHTQLLTQEARLTKQLYRLAVQATGYGDFTRASRGESVDAANQFLDYGNYLAYGMGATATWVLGLPHSLAVLHGKTRRGGLVFDVADLVKDATILPQAFISAMRGDTAQVFRQTCIEALTHSESLDFMIDTVKATALSIGQLAVRLATVTPEADR